MPKGRDGSGSVAALAVQVDKLRRQVQALAAKLDALADTQQIHAADLNGVAGLRAQVERILATLTSEADDAQGTWCWLTMSDTEREDRLAELTDWVKSVLRPEYPDYLADHLKPCWPNHPEARWELAWLYQLWTRAYLTRRSDPREAADWHDRWLPGALHRLAGLTRQCDHSANER